MRKIKRVVACLCVCVLLATAPATAYARSSTFIANTGAEEVIVVGGLVIGTETALGWALSLLGFTAAANAVYENRDNWIGWCNTQADRLKNWMSARADDISVTWGQMQNWLNDIANGAMDTASDCYDTFLDFCTDLANAVANDDTSSSSPGIPSETVDGLVVGDNPGWSQNIQDFHFYQGMDVSLKYVINGFKEVGVSFDNWPYSYYPDVYPDATSWVHTNKVSSEDWFMINLYLDQRYGAGSYDLSGEQTGYSVTKGDCKRLAYYINTELGYIQAYYLEDGILKYKDYKGLSSDLEEWSGEWVDIMGRRVETISNVPFFTSLEVLQKYLETGTLDNEQDWSYVCGDFLPSAYSFTSNFEMVIGNGLPCDKDVGEGTKPGTGEATFGDVADVVVAPPTEDIIDRDGNLDNVRVGGQTISGEISVGGVISVPVDGVDLEGVSNPYNVIDGVRPVDGVFPIDIITGVVIGTDTPIEDIPPVNIPQPGGDYTITGLDELFPFCIPFDLVNLFSCLKAEPAAPKFKFPIPVPDGKMKFHYEYIEIDLSKFDSAAKVLRMMEFLAFCVALTLVTRNLIRG